MSKPPRHHYIPQCYQRRFSADRVFVKYLNKSTGIHSSTPIDDFCQKENFYYLEHSSKHDYLETDFFAHNIEEKLGKLLTFFDSINGDNDNVPFNKDRKIKVAEQIVMQYMRTPQYREIKYENETIAYLSQLYVLLEKTGFEVEYLGFEGDKAEFHKRRLCDTQEIEKIIESLVDAHWELLYAPNEEFYTSDNPIVIQERQDMPVTYCDAIKFFDEIFFPLNPKLLLHIIAMPAVNKKYLTIHTTHQDRVTEINSIIQKKAQDYIIYKEKYY